MPETGSQRLDPNQSSILQYGRDAYTIGEMAEWAELLEHRPLVEILRDLPSLAQFSQAKFSLAATLIRRRFRQQPLVNRKQLRIVAFEISEDMASGAARDRVRSLFPETS